MKIKLTHKGWFGLCPVYFADIDSDAPLAEPRHWSLGWLMHLSVAIYSAVIFMKTVIDPEWMPVWPLRVTGELAVPIWTEGHEE